MSTKLVAVLLGVAVLAGCGADGAGSAPPPGARPPEAALTGAPPPGAPPPGAPPLGAGQPAGSPSPGGVVRPPVPVPPNSSESPVPAPPMDVPASMLVTPGERSGSLESLTLPTGARFRVITNFPMAGAKDVTRAVIVVHGDGRTARADFERMLAAARAAGVDRHTIIVAPWFLSDRRDQPAPEEIAWQDQTWKQGYGSEQGDLSSFMVMDQLVASLASRDRFPAMRHITVAGHSAGGQFTQRYAVFGRAPNLLPWMTFNFSVMNPSSYLYFGPERPTADGARFAAPPAESCPGYDDYRYGLRRRQGYVAELTPEQALKQYLGRRVTILNGAGDTLDNHNLDTTCSANLEGPSRLARGTYYYSRIHGVYPQAPHDRVVIPGVGHDTGRMFASRQSWPSLFGQS